MGKHRYGVILDAGSSGTRVHVYSWLKHYVARENASEEELHTLPKLETKNKKWTKKVHPGISEFGDKPDKVGPDYLKELFDFALDVVPKGEVQTTPIFLLGTAGMRLLLERPRNALLGEICKAAKDTGFLLSDCGSHIQVISGETEGLYGWVAANYLVGGFDRPADHDHGKGHHTYGFLEMGGASAQIAFAPNSTETDKHADDLKLLRLRTIDGEMSEYKVFVTTFLGYGADEARKRYIEALPQPASGSQAPKMLDPCLPSGLELTKAGKIIHPGSLEAEGSEARLVGTGKFASCLSRTFPLLDKQAACPNKPCLFHGVHAPAIDFDVNHFIGVSNFWHGTHDIFNMGHKDAVYDFKTYQSRVTAFCNRSWESIEQDIEAKKLGDKVDEEAAAETCFKASWLINMLHEGIGVPRKGLEGDADAVSKNGTTEVLESAKQDGFLMPFQAVNKIDDTEVSWTLGRMVLYAASQVPPAMGNALDVGIVNNTKEEAHSKPSKNNRPRPPKKNRPPPNDKPLIEGDLGGAFYDYNKVDDNADTDYNDDQLEAADRKLTLHRLLNTDNLRRTPGFVFFLIILAVIGILLCGRERRANLARKIKGLCGCARNGGGAIQLGRGTTRQLPFGLGGRRERKYEQLMEEGDIPNPGDFELGNMTGSDDDRASHSSKSSSSSQTSSRGKKGSVVPRRSAAASPHLPV